MKPTQQPVRTMALCSTLLSLVLAACGGGGTSVEDTHAAATAAPTADAEPDAVVAAADTDIVGDAVSALSTVGTVLRFPISGTELSAVGRPFPTRHLGLGEGVPLYYDWAEYSRLRTGNTPPAGMGALTGWGQVFWLQGTAAHTHQVEIRSVQTWLCSTADRRWTRVQNSAPEGAAFWPDFSNNTAIPATMVTTASGSTRIGFPAGRAFHYWPKAGRAAFDGKPHCGLVTAFQARAVAADGSPLPDGTPAQMVIGAGADYWTTTTAAWADNTTNPGIALGQLRLLTPYWRWYGLSTASSTDLNNLATLGFVERTAP